jgi:DNA-binding NarL/FixJ family response regulator
MASSSQSIGFQMPSPQKVRRSSDALVSDTDGQNAPGSLCPSTPFGSLGGLQTLVLNEEVSVASETELAGPLPILPAPQEQRLIRVLVVDHYEVIRKGVSATLQEAADFVIAGEAGMGNEAVTLARLLRPDIVMLDVFLGTNNNGLDVAQQIMRACPGIHVVIFTAATDNEYLFRAMRIGVHGYLQKSLPLRDLLAALRSVYNGERVLGEAHSMTQILTEFSRLTKEQERSRSGLSDIEIELVRLAAEGCSNKEIAARQFWSEVTVKRKMQDIYRKLQVTDRAQAVAEAMRMGLI